MEDTKSMASDSFNRSSSEFNFSSFESSWLEKLIAWSKVCTGQDHLEGRLQLLHEAGELYRSLGAQVEIIEKQTQAPLLVARFQPEHPRRVLLFGHLDTVFNQTHPFQSVWIEGDRLRGPGVCDMKSGVLVMYEALKKVVGQKLDLGWSVVLNSDEEIGSPISGPIWKKLAPGHFCALGFEPAITTSSHPRCLAKSRMGSLNLRVTFKGKSAHAGRNPESGASAIHAACRWWTGLEDSLKGTKGLKMNAGKIEGGQGSNIVAEHASIDINLRTENATVLDTFFKHAQEQTEKLPAPLIVHQQVLTARAPKPATEQSLRLAHLVVALAKEQSLEIELESTAGVCDGNNIQELGLPTIDNLGPVGGGLHSDQEWVELRSIEEQIQLVISLLEQLAKPSYL